MSEPRFLPFFQDVSRKDVKWILLTIKESITDDYIRELMMNILCYLQKYDMLEEGDIPILMLVKSYSASTKGIPFIGDSDKVDRDFIRQMLSNVFIGQKMIKQTINQMNTDKVILLMENDCKIIGQLEGPYEYIKAYEHIFVG